MRKGFLQIVKYGLVGIANTALTTAVIYILLYLFLNKEDESSSSLLLLSIINIIGYLVGLINSFILNRCWTFQSKTDWKSSFARFLLAFGICFLLQLVVVLCCNHIQLASPYVCQLIGIVVYSGLNFVLNKYYTFRNRFLAYENS